MFTPLLIIAIAAGPIGVSAQDESAADQAIWNTGSLPDDNSIDPGGLAKEQAGAVTDPAVSRQRQEEAWGHMQRSIVPLRSALADDGWVRAGHRPSGTVSNLDGQYSAEAAWMLRDPSGTPKALLRQARDGLVASSAPLIRSSETDDELKLEASTADGVLITVEIYADSDRLDSTRYVYVSARGPAHWSEGATVDWSGEHTARELEVLLGADPEMPQPRFAADEWPELSLEMTPLS